MNKLLLLALVGCSNSAPEWANNDPDVLAMQRSVRAAEESWLAATAKCEAALDAIVQAAQRARPPQLTSWPTGAAVCWTPANGPCHPDVLRHLKITSPCGASSFPEIMPSQVRTKDKAKVLVEARTRLAAFTSKVPIESPVFDALYLQDCHTTSKLGDVEAHFAEPGQDLGGTGGFVRCDVAVMTLDASHAATALAFATASGVLAPKGGSAGTYSEQEVSTALDTAMASTLDEAVGKLAAQLQPH